MVSGSNLAPSRKRLEPGDRHPHDRTRSAVVLPLCSSEWLTRVLVPASLDGRGRWHGRSELRLDGRHRLRDSRISFLIGCRAASHLNLSAATPTTAEGPFRRTCRARWTRHLRFESTFIAAVTVELSHAHGCRLRSRLSACVARRLPASAHGIAMSRDEGRDEDTAVSTPLHTEGTPLPRLV